jgi:hypothetical protein
MVDRYDSPIRVGDQVCVVASRKPCIGTIVAIRKIGQKERADVKVEYSSGRISIFVLTYESTNILLMKSGILDFEEE